MKVTVNEPADQEVVGNKTRETKIKVVIEEAQFDELQEEIEELEKKGFQVDVNVNGKIPKG